MVEIRLCIDDSFENDFIEDRFKDFFDRVIADIKASHFEGLCGNYELETASFLREAFEKSWFSI